MSELVWRKDVREQKTFTMQSDWKGGHKMIDWNRAKWSEILTVLLESLIRTRRLQLEDSSSRWMNGICIDQNCKVFC